jgi:radical SAM superfamily enzyme YgiQ (UPF0313 family)
MPVYPLALAQLAGALREAGHTVHLFDVIVHELDSPPEVLRQAQPDLIGVSLRNIDNTNASEPRDYFDEYRRLIRQLRIHSSAPIAIGGSAFSLFPRQLMEMLQPDFGIVGPGETALCQLLEVLDSGNIENIPNLLTTGAECIAPISSVPALTTMCHDGDLVDFYWQNGGMIGIQTKRGCPKNCSYCTYPSLEGTTVSWADPGSVVDDMERLLVSRGVDYFFIVDSLFNISPKQEQAFAEEICRRSLKLSWGAFFSPAGIEKDYMSLLKKSGLTHVEFGTDSLCDAMLGSYQKDFAVADVVRASSLCTKMGLYVAHYLILGGPGESEETIRLTARNARYHEKCYFLSFPGVRIYPATALYETALAEGIVAGVQDCLAPKFYLARPLTASSIWQTLESQLDDSRRWFLPGKSAMIRNSVGRLRKRGKKGPLWEYMLM